jgi:hypothetical protein
MACMEAFTRFLLVTAIRILKEIFVFGTLASALVIILAGVKAPREIVGKHIPGKAEAE